MSKCSKSGEIRQVQFLRHAAIVIVEGFSFLRSITPRWRLLPSRAYLQWRLGTVYGSFDRETGAVRGLSVLLRDLWRDRANVCRFLLWRQQMRRHR